jgi:C-terminal processing protease CtpA/Prc
LALLLRQSYSFESEKGWSYLFIDNIPTKVFGLITMVGLLVMPGWSQHVDRLERERARVMLEDVDSDIRKYYYDSKLHGVDWDTTVRNAKERIAKATTREALILEIAAVLEALNDSHTVFVPPQDPIRQDYGWGYQMIGNHCYVTHVRPKSDAEIKGLKPGDEVLSINGFAPTRQNLSKMGYLFYVLLPLSSLRVDIRDQSGNIRRVDVKAKIRQTKTIMDLDEVTGRDAWRLRLEYEDREHLMRPQSKELGKELMIIKLPMFSDASRLRFDKAREHSCLVVDLRSSAGGAESTLQDLLGSVFERDVKIADRITRETTIPAMAKGSHHNAFSGRLIVLVDSRSASAAELFARVIQIEKRGIVLGDRTPGSVMEAKYYGHRTGINPFFSYGTSVASADLVMSDGKSLEHTGVTPDETILPTAADLANDRDTVMARAAEMAGVTLSPEEAAKLFPYEWPMN